MGNMQNLRDTLFKKAIDLIYGEFSETEKTQDETISYFKDSLIKWKGDPKYQKILGPLQPANIMSRMYKITEDEVLVVVDDLEITLPESIDLSEFKLNTLSEEKARDFLLRIEGAINPEEELISILSYLEEKKEDEKKAFRPSAFEFVDMTEGEEYDFDEIPDSAPTTFRAISFLQKMTKMLLENKVHSMTMITLLDDGTASIWIPPYVSDSDIENLYDPLIEVLKHAGNVKDKN